MIYILSLILVFIVYRYFYFGKKIIQLKKELNAIKEKSVLAGSNLDNLNIGSEVILTKYLSVLSSIRGLLISLSTMNMNQELSVEINNSIKLIEKISIDLETGTQHLSVLEYSKPENEFRIRSLTTVLIENELCITEGIIVEFIPVFIGHNIPCINKMEELRKLV